MYLADTVRYLIDRKQNQDIMSIIFGDKSEGISPKNKGCIKVCSLQLGSWWFRVSTNFTRLHQLS